MEQEFEEFEKLLKRHDWYYQFSDDQSVWRDGHDSEHKIQYLYDKLKKVDPVRATNLYLRYNQKN